MRPERFDRIGLPGVRLAQTEQREPVTPVAPVTWFRDEVYVMTDADGSTHRWNVTRARQLAQARGEVITFAPGEFGITAEHIKQRYSELDEAYALTRDLSQPLLFVPFQGVAQLIDGWHRLHKAVVLGVEQLPAYLLTEEEAQATLLDTVPAGQSLPSARFDVGRLVVTTGALAAIQANAQSPLLLVQRHEAGDWGELSEEDKAVNEQSLTQGGRLLSAYILADGVTKVWVITEADRSCTTTLLPEEY